MSSNIAPLVARPARRRSTNRHRAVDRRSARAAVRRMRRLSPMASRSFGSPAERWPLSLVLIVGLLALVVVSRDWHVLAASRWSRLKLADGIALHGRNRADRNATSPKPSALDRTSADDRRRRRERKSPPSGGLATRRVGARRQFRADSRSRSNGSTISQIVEQSRPEWALTIERHGERPILRPTRGHADRRQSRRGTPDEAWQTDSRNCIPKCAPAGERACRSKMENGAVRRKMKQADLAQIQAELDYGNNSPQYAAAGRIASKPMPGAAAIQRDSRPRSTA